MMRASLVLAMLAVVGACNDDVDLTGVYRVEADLASSPCGNDMAVMMPPVALKLAKDEFLGVSYFAYEECSDEAATMCSGGGLGAGLSEPIDGGWRGIITSAGSGGGSSCTISYTEQKAVLHGSLLIVESSQYADIVDNTPELCSPDEAERRNTSMACAAHERIEATKL